MPTRIESELMANLATLKQQIQQNTAAIKRLARQVEKHLSGQEELPADPPVTRPKKK